jgi:hypothetical protein
VGPHGTNGTTIHASVRAMPRHETSAGVKNGTQANAAKRNVATRRMTRPRAFATVRTLLLPSTVTATACSAPHVKKPIHARGG